MRPSIRIIFSLLVVALAGALAAGCGSSAGSATAAGHRVKAAVPPATIAIIAKSDAEHGRKGPDGKWHDAFLPADLTVRAGQRVTLTFANYDDMAHSFNAAQLGVNVTIPGGTAHKPGTATVTFTAPTRAGAYLWICAIPCDPWAMSHDGYMRGYVRVTA
ncbi:MAG TPA: cupredoxin domain-containing protein [Conexibacter sp.]|nr:cupredoxin domain-containing protein [Conexibacter sp.]